MQSETFVHDVMEAIRKIKVHGEEPDAIVIPLTREEHRLLSHRKARLRKQGRTLIARRTGFPFGANKLNIKANLF